MWSALVWGLERGIGLLELARKNIGCSGEFIYRSLLSTVKACGLWCMYLAQLVARWPNKDLGLSQVDQPPKRLYLAKPNFTMGVESSQPRMKDSSCFRYRTAHDEEEMVVTVVEQIAS